jgi:hypothetical protein
MAPPPYGLVGAPAPAGTGPSHDRIHRSVHVDGGGGFAYQVEDVGVASAPRSIDTPPRKAGFGSADPLRGRPLADFETPWENA